MQLCALHGLPRSPPSQVSQVSQVSPCHARVSARTGPRRSHSGDGQKTSPLTFPWKTNLQAVAAAGGCGCLGSRRTSRLYAAQSACGRRCHPRRGRFSQGHLADRQLEPREPIRPFAKNNFRNPHKRLVRLFESFSLKWPWIAGGTTRCSGASTPSICC